MPRTYVCKKALVDRDAVAQCLQAYDEGGISLRQAATNFNLPYTTVQRHFQAKRQSVTLPPVGRLPSLPIHISTDIAVIAKTAAANGFGLLKVELKAFIGDFHKANWDSDCDVGHYLRQNCRFRDKVPSDEWLTEFMQHHHLSLVVPSAMEKVRKDATSDPFLIYHYYDILEKEINTLGLQNSPSHIYNVDESAFFLDPSRGKVVAATGAGAQRAIAGSGRDCFTVMATVNAAGQYLAPLIIFKAKHLYDSWRGCKALPGTTYSTSSNGWMTTEVFLEWFRIFIRTVKERPLILILDGHRTHLSLPFIQLARENGITAIKLPAHTTSRLQPLDISCFKPLKAAWDRRLVSYQREHGFRHVSKSESVDILCSVWGEALTPENIKAGFIGSGTFPCDKNKYPIQVFIPTKLASYRAQSPSLPPQELNVIVTPAASLTMSSSCQPSTSNTGLLSPGLTDVFISRFCSQKESVCEVVQKRRKIQRSSAVITHEDYTKAIQEVDAMQKVKQTFKQQIVKKINSSSSSEEEEVPCRMNKSLPIRKPLAPISSDEEMHEVVLRVNDFVVLRLIPACKSKEPVHFVGVIMAQSSEKTTWKVQCMRRHRADSLNEFVFPPVDDIDDYRETDIIEVLLQPKIARGVHHFTDDMLPFQKNLR